MDIIRHRQLHGVHNPMLYALAEVGCLHVPPAGIKSKFYSSAVDGQQVAGNGRHG
jgi:hypothetical protein